MHKTKKLWLVICLFVQIIAIRFLKNFPEVVEAYYSNGLYTVLSRMMRYSFGWLPFSVGDVFYTLASIYIIRWLVLNRKRILKNTLDWTLDVLAAVSIGYFAFHILWGFNYYRQPLHKTLNLNAEYTTESLLEITNALIEKSNNLHHTLSKSDTLMVVIPYSKQNVLDSVPKGYFNLSKIYPHLNYKPSSLKTSIYSLPLTYMGFSGYLNPFTNEAQIDQLIPTYKFPTTASHEVAHQLGYAAENEANFIGSLAAINHSNEYFKYSGYTFALSHCLNDLYRRDPEVYKSILSKINKGILKNYNEVSLFWQAYQNVAEPVFKSTFDNFLKANRQSDGIKTYSYVVALYVNYFKEHPL